MAASGGPGLVKDGLVFSIDGASRRSTLRYTQTSNIIPDAGNWSTGTGGQTGYGVNGSSSEQNRVLVSDDPWGRSSITWRTTPDSTSGADGGWNGNYYSVDTSYTYRYSVWVRRYTSGTGGTFYFGMNPNPYRNDNDASQGNPYFVYTAISNLTQDQWYLVVAHVFYEGYEGGRHPESGWYRNGAKIDDIAFGNTGTVDTRWIPGTTSARHRTYHYYTTNTASGIEFAYPRIDKIDGKEPTISELLNKGESGIRDLVSKDVYTMTNGNSYINDGGKSTFSFDGTDDYIDLGTALNSYSTVTIEVVFKSTQNGSTDFRNIIGWGAVSSGTNYSGISIGNITSGYSNESLHVICGGNTLQMYILEDHSTYHDNQFHHVVATLDPGNNRVYIDGVEKSVTFNYGNINTDSGGFNQTNNVTYIGRRPYNTSAYLQGEIPVVKVYNRVLTADEISKNYRVYKNRFNI